MLAGGAGRCISNQGEREENAAEDGERRGNESLRPEGGQLHVRGRQGCHGVKKPLLAVRRLVEKGNRVVLSAGDGESYIQNVSSKIKIPIKKKGGSFVIEANFVKKAMDFARRA